MTSDYVCLKCGNVFVVNASAEKKCSKCGSTNVLKLSPSGIFGFSGGGGG
jgi:DNA-directed RNA polymerase subunit RPC12/RpoP